MPSHSLSVVSALATAVPAKVAALAAERELSATSAPVPARGAATVVVVRDADAGGLETFLLHRHARMAFAASMAVFPGGGIDPVDQRTSDPVRACAVRETLEETGVELAVGDLVPWAHWITPELQPIRYDTFFYLAALPPDQVADDLSTETDRAAWTRPADALAAHAAGTLALMPPTLSILIELSRVSSVAEALRLGQERVIETVLPLVVRDGDGWVFSYPSPPEERA